MLACRRNPSCNNFRHRQRGETRGSVNATPLSRVIPALVLLTSSSTPVPRIPACWTIFDPIPRIIGAEPSEDSARGPPLQHGHRQLQAEAGAEFAYASFGHPQRARLPPPRYPPQFEEPRAQRRSKHARKVWSPFRPVDALARKTAPRTSQFLHINPQVCKPTLPVRPKFEIEFSVRPEHSCFFQLGRTGRVGLQTWGLMWRN